LKPPFSSGISQLVRLPELSPAALISLCEKRIELGVDPFDDDLVQLEIQLLAGALQVDQPGMCQKTMNLS
jgi:hypothetical protein